MVGMIYETKNRILEHIAHQMQERGVEGVNTNELGMLVDMVKDLAEAEKSCYEADYYRSVSEAMENGGQLGYSNNYENGYGNRGAGYTQQNRSGWSNQYGSGRSRGHMGYTDMAESVRMAMQGMAPDERDRMREQLRGIMDGM